jgi:hypothetical protein
MEKKHIPALSDYSVAVFVVFAVFSVFIHSFLPSFIHYLFESIWQQGHEVRECHGALGTVTSLEAAKQEMPTRGMTTVT